MTIRIAALLLTCLLVAPTAPGFGQEAENLPDSSLTREQWQQRVEAARRRSEEFVATARTQTGEPPPPLDEAKEATDRAMNDPTLQQGDIISTSKGFVVFVGRDEQHQPSDFRSAPASPPPH